MRAGTSNPDRSYHAGGGRTPVAASRTPRRDHAGGGGGGGGGTPQTAVVAANHGHARGQSHARERALQDPGLKDYVRVFDPSKPFPGEEGHQIQIVAPARAISRGTARIR